MSHAHRSRFRRPVDHVARTVLFPRAREMRIQATASEAILWAALRRDSLGVRFRRQVVLGGFIVDFLAPSARLVVEVDGGIHQQQVDYDRRRDEALRLAGYTVLRLPAELVERSLEDALARVRAALSA